MIIAEIALFLLGLAVLTVGWINEANPKAGLPRLHVSDLVRTEGTTWYRHGLWPSSYWKLWADAILHRIHLRVLRHIAAGAESEALRGARTPPTL